MRGRLPILPEELDVTRVLWDDYGQVGADALYLIEKPGFAEIRIEDMNKQGVHSASPVLHGSGRLYLFRHRLFLGGPKLPATNFRANLLAVD